jgi:hypothetical protein
MLNMTRSFSGLGFEPVFSIGRYLIAYNSRELLLFYYLVCEAIGTAALMAYCASLG